MQVLYDSHWEDQEQEEIEVQDAGGVKSEDRNKAGSVSGSRKDSTVNRHTQGLPWHKRL